MANYHTSMGNYKPSVSATATTQRHVLGADKTTTSTSYVASGLTLTEANSSGVCVIIMNVVSLNSGAGGKTTFAFADDTTPLATDQQHTGEGASVATQISMAWSKASDSSVMTVYLKVDGGTGTIKYTSAEKIPTLMMVEH